MPSREIALQWSSVDLRVVQRLLTSSSELTIIPYASPNWSGDLEEAKIVAMVIFAEQMGVWDIDKQPIRFLEMLKRAYVTPGHPRLFAPCRTEALSVIFHDCTVVAVSLQTHFVNVKVFGAALDWKKLHAGVNEVQAGLIDLKATVDVFDALCEGLAEFCLPLQNSRWCALFCTTWTKYPDKILFCSKKM